MDFNSTKDIDGFDGYRVSKTGVVYSCWDRKAGSISRKTNEWKQLRFYVDKDGYHRVSLRKSGLKYSKKIGIHRLVANAFLPNLLCHKLVRHIDSNPSNNHISNLAWGTQKENIRDEIIRGTFRGYNKLSINFVTV